MSQLVVKFKQIPLTPASCSDPQVRRRGDERGEAAGAGRRRPPPQQPRHGGHRPRGQRRVQLPARRRGARARPRARAAARDRGPGRPRGR